MVLHCLATTNFNTEFENDEGLCTMGTTQSDRPETYFHCGLRLWGHSPQIWCSSCYSKYCLL